MTTEEKVIEALSQLIHDCRYPPDPLPKGVFRTTTYIGNRRDDTAARIIAMVREDAAERVKTTLANHALRVDPESEILRAILGKE